jgi:MFS transporter, AAHS family, benzoate transport protein
MATTVRINQWIDESRFTRFHLLIFFLCLCIITFDGYDLVIYGAAVPLLLKEFALNPAQAGVMGSYALFGAALGAVVFGSLADRIGRKRAIVICAALFSAATGVTGLASSAALFGVCRFLAGLGIGGAMPNVVALASDYAPLRNRTLMVATIFSGMQIGGIMAAGMSMWLFPVFGWRSVFWVGALPLLLFPAFIKFLPESPIHLLVGNRIGQLRSVLHKVRPDLPLPDDAEFVISKGTGKTEVTELFREHRGFSSIMIWIVYFMNMYMIFGLGTWLPKLMMDAGFDLGSGLWFLLTLNLGAFFGSQVAGLTADRIGSKVTLLFLYLLACASITMLSFTRDFYLLTALVALAGTGFFGGQNVAHGYVSLFYPPGMRSTAMGLAFGVGRLGAIFGPALAGFLLAMKVSQLVNFVGLAVPGLIAGIAILLVRDKHGYSGTQRVRRLGSVDRN